MGIINEKIKKYGSFAPGPGTYVPKFVSEVQLSYSMGAKIKNLSTVKSALLPGPGVYDPKP